jgi:hypothetical protein
MKQAKRGVRDAGDFSALFDIYERLLQGKNIDAPEHKSLLLGVVTDILGDADPRTRFFEVKGAAKNHHHFFVALDVHLQPDFATAPKKALARVADSWELSAERVRGIERQMRKHCGQYLNGKSNRDRADTMKLVEMHRKRWLEVSAQN